MHRILLPALAPVLLLACSGDEAADSGSTNCGSKKGCPDAGSAEPGDPNSDGGGAPDRDARAPEQAADAGPPPESGGPTDGGGPTPESVYGPCGAAGSGRPLAHFNIPFAAGWERGDYFQLPFPNVLHETDGKIDLFGFPAETATFENILSTVNGSVGFGNYPTTIFRFSSALDPSSLNGNVHMLDITTPKSPEAVPLKFRYEIGGGKYVCHNSVSVRPTDGTVLGSSQRYVVWLGSDVKGADGKKAKASPHFSALRSTSVPDDPVLRDAHARYAPFRQYLKAEGIEPAAVLNATLFNSSDPRAPMRNLAAAARELPAPKASAWIKCGGAEPSPCPDTSGSRACGAASPDYAEFHGLVSLPIFQKGKAPYFASGGEIPQDVTAADRKSDEKVCVSLTIPTGEPPENGYPLVIRGHGAGGSFTSGVRRTIAGNLSTAETPSGASARAAVLSYDEVQHGPRRGTGTFNNADPEFLLFNFINPAGTVGTGLQGALDVLSLGRLAKGLAIPTALTGDTEVRIDHENLTYWGQSQGSMQAAVSLAYADEFQGAVLAGLGGGFLHSLITRKVPALVPESVAAGVFDPGEQGDLIFNGEFHPALSLLQQVVDPIDPLHHAALLVQEPEGQALHVFQPYGTGDTASPGLTMQSFATAAGLTLAQAHPSAVPKDDLGEESATFPLLGNVASAEGSWTAGIRQYGPPSPAPATYNGHFVGSFEANPDIIRFLSMIGAGEIPQIGQ